MIEHTTFLNQSSVSSQSDVPKIINSYNTILEANDWGTNSLVQNGANAPDAYGRYYFTENSYIELGSYLYRNNWAASIKLVTPNKMREINFTDSVRYTISVGKTSKGICISYLSSIISVSRDPRFYNLYVGEVTHLDGTITKGCIYVNNDNSYIVATDKGISEEPAFVSTIDNARKAQLVAAADSTTGAIFNDIYMMFNTPLQYNKMKILGTGKTFLLGKSLCLAD